MFQVSISDQTAQNLQKFYLHSATWQSTLHCINNFEDLESETMSVNSLSSSESANENVSDTSVGSASADHFFVQKKQSRKKTQTSNSRPRSMLTCKKESNLSPTLYDVSFHVCHFSNNEIICDHELAVDSSFLREAMNVAVRVEQERCLRFCSVAGDDSRLGVVRKYEARPHDIRLQRTRKAGKCNALKVRSYLSLENVRSIVEQLTDWLDPVQCITASVSKSKEEEERISSIQEAVKEEDNNGDGLMFRDAVQPNIKSVAPAMFFVSFTNSTNIGVQTLANYLLARCVVVDSSGVIELVKFNPSAPDYHAGMSFFSIKNDFLTLDSLVIRSDHDAKLVENVVNKTIKHDLSEKKSRQASFVTIKLCEVDRPPAF